MTPRVREYAAQEAARAGVCADLVLRSFPGNGQGHPAKAARRAVLRRLRADGFTTTQIGRWFGIDHSTVIYWTRP